MWNPFFLPRSCTSPPLTATCVSPSFLCRTTSRWSCATATTGRHSTPPPAGVTLTFSRSAHPTVACCARDPSHSIRSSTVFHGIVKEMVAALGGAVTFNADVRRICNVTPPTHCRSFLLTVPCCNLAPAPKHRWQFNASYYAVRVRHKLPNSIYPRHCFSD